MFGNINLNTIVVAQSEFPLNISGANNYSIPLNASFNGVGPLSNCANFNPPKTIFTALLNTGQNGYSPANTSGLFETIMSAHRLVSSSLE